MHTQALYATQVPLSNQAAWATQVSLSTQAPCGTQVPLSNHAPSAAQAPLSKHAHLSAQAPLSNQTPLSVVQTGASIQFQSMPFTQTPNQRLPQPFPNKDVLSGSIPQVQRELFFTPGRTSSVRQSSLVEHNDEELDTSFQHTPQNPPRLSPSRFSKGVKSKGRKKKARGGPPCFNKSSRKKRNR